MMRRRKRVTMQLSSAAVDTSRRSSRWCTLKYRRVSQFHNRCRGRDIGDRFIGPRDGREKSRLQEGKRGSPRGETEKRKRRSCTRWANICLSESTNSRSARTFPAHCGIRCVVVALVAIIAQIEQRQRRSIGEDPSRGKRKKKLAGSEI